MTINDINKLFEKIEAKVEIKERKYLHPKSIKNFLKHFENLPKNCQELVKDQLESYCQDIDNLDGKISKKESFSFGMTYVMTLGAIYEKELFFKPLMDWGFIIFWGCIFDLGLFISGIAHLYFNIPLCLILLILRKIYYLKLEKKRKVYGLFY